MRIKALAKTATGFTLLEVLVSLVILSLLSAGMLSSYSQQMNFGHQGRLRSGAVMAAQQVLDELRVEDPADLLPEGADPDRSVSVGDSTYVVKVRYCQPDTYCTSNSIRYIHVEVDHKGTKQYEVDTVYTQLR